MYTLCRCQTWPQTKMAIQFCGPCGNILDTSTNRTIRCDYCGSVNDSTFVASCAYSRSADGRTHLDTTLDTVTDTSTDKFPSEIRQRRDTTKQLPRQAAVDTWATTEEKCRNCGAEEVRYTALQLRSADEGTTLFYHCPKCSER